jgi:hypothetical protein
MFVHNGFHDTSPATAARSAGAVHAAGQAKAGGENGRFRHTVMIALGAGPRRQMGL